MAFRNSAAGINRELWSSASIQRNERSAPKRLTEEGWGMTIGKKLYLSFGIILATVLVLLAINLVAVQREHETKAAAQRSIDMAEATSIGAISDDAEPPSPPELPP